MDRPTKEALSRALAGRILPDTAVAGMQPAGVLVLVYGNRGREVVLLSRRSETLPEHPGEMSFPGGRKEAGDESLLATALREAQEEVGVTPSEVEILGLLGQFTTVSNYAIEAYVGTADRSCEFAINTREVDCLLEVPLEELSGLHSSRDDIRVVEGDLVVMPSFAYDGRIIYGATARMLDRLIEVFAQVRSRAAA